MCPSTLLVLGMHITGDLMEEPYPHDCHLCSEELVDLTLGVKRGLM